MDETVDVGPVITRSEVDRIAEWVAEAESQGAEVLTGGTADGPFFQPTLISRTTPEMKVRCEEVFGPVCTITPYETFDEALAEVNDSKYGLQAGRLHERHQPRVRGPPHARGRRRHRERRQRVPRRPDAVRRVEGIGVRSRGPAVRDGGDDRTADHGALARAAVGGHAGAQLSWVMCVDRVAAPLGWRPRRRRRRQLKASRRSDGAGLALPAPEVVVGAFDDVQATERHAMRRTHGPSTTGQYGSLSPVSTSTGFRSLRSSEAGGACGSARSFGWSGMPISARAVTRRSSSRLAQRDAGAERPAADDDGQVRRLLPNPGDGGVHVAHLIETAAVGASGSHHAPEVEGQHGHTAVSGELVPQGPEDRMVLAAPVAGVRVADRRRAADLPVGQPQLSFEPHAVIGRERDPLHPGATMAAGGSLDNRRFPSTSRGPQPGTTTPDLHGPRRGVH